MKILFADDIRDTRDLFAMAFRQAGHEVVAAASGTEAVAAVEQEQFDVVVLDIEMPLLDGWEAARSIRQLPHGRSVPVILFTAYDHLNAGLRTIQVGADGLLKKPMLPSELLERLKTYI